ncbi:L,D-transpeptidase family protein [Sinisalibacter lacisalsi]|uniref:L,D-TPase catalytic domain-containing protein n=1 Tax=Sinisalibacter lacisalsi TaxID=1526570 RepID=A0ABQ1QBW2_9RHOB|nr:L,D-transpeptidase family protein [Sinisalibacter lacisalsi]GGD21341.1 hypothetical protein GCM10011358_02230 [Sinisalibacter lacisalsi]
MRALLKAVMLIGLLGLASCSKFRTYDGPEVTRILVFKDARTMYLMNGESVLESYAIDLGFAPSGQKEREGDGKTPEGSYIIDRKNPNSEFHLSLGISYPEVHERLAAKEAGQNPGGDIFIHGGPSDRRLRGKPDWTAGCIAVTDRQIEDIYAMVNIGTPIEIRP